MTRQELEEEYKLLKNVFIPVMKDSYDYLSSKKKRSWKQEAIFFEYEDMLKKADETLELLEKALGK